MKFVVVFGSRGAPRRLLPNVISLLDRWEPDCVVSGCARGGDRIGEEAARALDIRVREMPANWHIEGRSAGYRRNERMAAIADAGIALWDGESRGTAHMIRLLRAKNVPLTIIRF